MIKVRGTIYVACQGNFYTGGPELLHQLVFKLNALGQNAKMYYYLKSESNPVHPNLSKYGLSYVESVEDHADDCIIVPEVDTHLLRYFAKAQKVIWWLSVDNYELATNKRTKFLEKIAIYRRFNFNVASHRRSVKHLCQSYYAQDFLRNKGLDSYFLSDYLNSDIIQEANKNAGLIPKEDLVLYNPKKGFEFTKLLIAQAPDLNWVPIEHLKPIEVVNLLMRAKLYIDFGYHPGKDRFPREAAISRCCVITGKRGAARNNVDIPIPDKYKFEDTIEEVPAIIQGIRNCLFIYDNLVDDFDSYRTVISGEELRFEEDIKQIFGLN